MWLAEKFKPFPAFPQRKVNKLRHITNWAPIMYVLHERNVMELFLAAHRAC